MSDNIFTGKAVPLKRVKGELSTNISKWIILVPLTNRFKEKYKNPGNILGGPSVKEPERTSKQNRESQMKANIL